MQYQTVIFDFDSTLIRFESLEEILLPMIGVDSKKKAAIQSITERAMNGQMSFQDALFERLNIASPTKASFEMFLTQYCPSALTSGIEALVKVLQANNIAVYIISGGFKEIILPFAEYLRIPKENVYAVELEWTNSGAFKHLNNQNGFAESKLAGAQRIQHLFSDKSVIVGDGFTDYELYHVGIVNDFIAYTEHAQRQKVLDVAPKVADSVSVLESLLFAGGY
ncbi:HAD-IB family phosphatase [Fangia hongkongensis]|uniref:HAD-IB family phosphatase n=1 Tax=Fangia hongkongensis TaxID=270495 RepID=UPI00036E1D30|nr:HAD-IB family phosphatase [Fangia hongkongensis]MBK2124172.1 HAD-IB family phosphatase [Fangia hongkongensis]